MHTLRTLDGSVEDILDPKFRIINFVEDGPQITVATHLRYAWSALPPEDAGEEPSKPSYGALGSWMAKNSRLSEAELQTISQNPEKDKVHTAWRDEIYKFWNHVFYDVGNFLSEVNGSAGHFRPPNHDVFALRYPGDGLSKGDAPNTAEVVVKKWDTNVLLIPTHLEPGVNVRMTTSEADGEANTVEMTRGTFSAETSGEIWYLRRGVEAKFYIGETKNSSQGVAAVMVVGLLSLDKDQNPAS